MPKKTKKAPLANLDFRVNPQLKQTLDEYCEENLEKPTEAIANSIKNFVGFGNNKIKRPDKLPEPDTGKTLRLNVRVHSRLKEELELYCEQSGESLTEVIINAIKIYIGCEISFQ